VNPPVDPPAIRKRKLAYRAAHRGIREMDLIIGVYVARHLDEFDDQQMSWLEALIDVPDQELFQWVCGSAEVPAEYDTPIMAALKSMRLGPGPADK